MPAFPYESCFQRVDQEFVTTSFPSSKHDQFVVSGIAPIQLPARKSTLSETIHQRPMRAGCWRFLHANDDKVTACGFRNDVRSRKVAFRPTVWLFREFSVRIINMNGLFARSTSVPSQNQYSFPLNNCCRTAFLSPEARSPAQ